MFAALLAEQYNTDAYHSDLKSLIFLGVFVILVIVVAIWWLRR